MRPLSPKISFKDNIIFNPNEVLKYKNKVDIFEKYVSMDLHIWMRNYQFISEKEYKEAISKDDTNRIENYYKLLSCLDNSVSYPEEEKKFNSLLSSLMNEDSDDFNMILEKLALLIREFELFLYDYKYGYKERLVNHSLDIFIAFSKLIEEMKDDISDDFQQSFSELFADGYRGDDKESIFPINTHTGMKPLDINSRFIIINIHGPFTVKNFKLNNSGKRFSAGNNKEIAFLDVKPKNQNEMLYKIIDSAEVIPRSSISQIDYIEVE